MLKQKIFFIIVLLLSIVKCNNNYNNKQTISNTIQHNNNRFLNKTTNININYQIDDNNYQIFLNKYHLLINSNEKIKKQLFNCHQLLNEINQIIKSINDNELINNYQRLKQKINHYYQKLINNYRSINFWLINSLQFILIILMFIYVIHSVFFGKFNLTDFNKIDYQQILFLNYNQINFEKKFCCFINEKFSVFFILDNFDFVKNEKIFFNSISDKILNKYYKIESNKEKNTIIKKLANNELNNNKNLTKLFIMGLKNVFRKIKKNKFYVHKEKKIKINDDNENIKFLEDFYHVTFEPIKNESKKKKIIINCLTIDDAKNETRKAKIEEKFFLNHLEATILRFRRNREELISDTIYDFFLTKITPFLLKYAQKDMIKLNFIAGNNKKINNIDDFFNFKIGKIEKFNLKKSRNLIIKYLVINKFKDEKNNIKKHFFVNNNSFQVNFFIFFVMFIYLINNLLFNCCNFFDDYLFNSCHYYFNKFFSFNKANWYYNNYYYLSKTQTAYYFCYEQNNSIIDQQKYFLIPFLFTNHHSLIFNFLNFLMNILTFISTIWFYYHRFLVSYFPIRILVFALLSFKCYCFINRLSLHLIGKYNFFYQFNAKLSLTFKKILNLINYNNENWFFLVWLFNLKSFILSVLFIFIGYFLAKKEEKAKFNFVISDRWQKNFKQQNKKHFQLLLSHVTEEEWQTALKELYQKIANENEILNFDDQ